jgi:hypothetical protein
VYFLTTSRHKRLTVFLALTIAKNLFLQNIKSNDDLALSLIFYKILVFKNDYLYKENKFI